nr:GyrI-like domain-containing protein [Methanosarcina barkeri]
MFWYARENNLETLGSSRELYFNVPAEVPEEELMTEIQVPIKEK